MVVAIKNQINRRSVFLISRDPAISGSWDSQYKLLSREAEP